MTLVSWWAFLALGLAAGVLSGFFGVGGGILIVPALIWLFGYSQHTAQGTSLVALVLPVGLLAAFSYYRAQPFPIKSALWIALGLFLGAYLGGIWAQRLSDRTLRVSFGVLTILAGIKLILGK